MTTLNCWYFEPSSIPICQISKQYDPHQAFNKQTKMDFHPGGRCSCPVWKQVNFDFYLFFYYLLFTFLCSPRKPPVGGILIRCPNQLSWFFWTPGKTQNTLEGLHLPAGLGTPRDLPEWARTCGWACCHRDPAPDMNGWMELMPHHLLVLLQ